MGQETFRSCAKHAAHRDDGAIRLKIKEPALLHRLPPTHFGPVFALSPFCICFKGVIDVRVYTNRLAVLL